MATLITVITGILGLITISGTNSSIQDLNDNDLQLLYNTSELEVLALTHRRYEKDFFLNIGKPDKQAGYVSKFQSTAERTSTLLEKMAAQVAADPHLSGEVKNAITTARSAYANYASGFITLAKSISRDETVTPQEANNMMSPLKEQIYIFEEGVKIMGKSGKQMVQEVSAKVITAGSEARIFILLTLTVAFTISLGLGIFITRLIRNPMRKAAVFASELAEGDFRNEIEISSNDEIGIFLRSLNTMVQTLKKTLENITNGIETLSSSSTELSTVSQTMSAEASTTSDRSRSVAVAAEEMSTNLNNVAAAMEESATNVSMVAAATEEMAATISTISNNAEKARTISEVAVTQAADASSSMNELNKAASDIGNVTETITEISEQTNLLALNATIEAARAGDAGKGFAVVANEIKDLAHQTAQATMDIKARIEDVQKTTGQTVGQIDKVVTVIEEINEIVSNMAISIEEQSGATSEITTNIAQAAGGIQEVNENVSSSSHVAQTITQDINGVSNSAKEINDSSTSVEQSAEQLAKLAEQLSSIVKQFRLN